MIAFLEGTIRAIEADYLVLQTSAGVGYQLFLPQILLSQALKNENCQYHVHTYVREGEKTVRDAYQNNGSRAQAGHRHPFLITPAPIDSGGLRSKYRPIQCDSGNWKKNGFQIMPGHERSTAETSDWKH